MHASWLSICLATVKWMLNTWSDVSIQVSIKFAMPLTTPCDGMVYRRQDGLATVDVEGRWLLS